MSMENQNNQNEKPANGYSQAPQQEEKSVLAELAEFVSRKKETTANVTEAVPEAKKAAQEADSAKEQAAPSGETAVAADASEHQKPERPAGRSTRGRGPRRPRNLNPKKEEGAEAENQPREERKPRNTRKPTVRAEKAENAEHSAKTEKPARAEKAEKPARAERPARSEKPARASKAKNVLADTSSKPKVRIIPLGGLEQIGMNITAFEYEDTIVVVDCGLAFPTDDMLGIDLVIPDVTYLERNIDKVKGFVITHGH